MGHFVSVAKTSAFGSQKAMAVDVQGQSVARERDSPRLGIERRAINQLPRIRDLSLCGDSSILGLLGINIDEREK